MWFDLFVCDVGCFFVDLFSLENGVGVGLFVFIIVIVIIVVVLVVVFFIWGCLCCLWVVCCGCFDLFGVSDDCIVVQLWFDVECSVREGDWDVVIVFCYWVLVCGLLECDLIDLVFGVIVQVIVCEVSVVFVDELDVLCCVVVVFDDVCYFGYCVMVVSYGEFVVIDEWFCICCIEVVVV